MQTPYSTLPIWNPKVAYTMMYMCRQLSHPNQEQIPSSFSEFSLGQLALLRSTQVVYVQVELVAPMTRFVPKQRPLHPRVFLPCLVDLQVENEASVVISETQTVWGQSKVHTVLDRRLIECAPGSTRHCLPSAIDNIASTEFEPEGDF